MCFGKEGGGKTMESINELQGSFSLVAFWQEKMEGRVN